MSAITVDGLEPPDSHVSKSIFYTSLASSNSSLQTEDSLIETRLVPSSISSINPRKEKNISCNLCDYTTSAKYYLNEHYRYVHMKVKVICDLCGKEFANINQHMRVTHKVLRSGILTKKPCQECHREYYDLTKHMAKAHQLKYEYDYNCEICNVKLKTKFILQRHMQRKHGTKATCQECGKKVSNLDVHIKKMHSRVEKYSCKICNEEFDKDSSLAEHLEICLEKNQASESREEIVTLNSKQILSDSFEVHLESFDKSKAEKVEGTDNEFILSQLRKLTPTNPSELQLLANYMFEDQEQESPPGSSKSISNTDGQFLMSSPSQNTENIELDDRMPDRNPEQILPVPVPAPELPKENKPKKPGTYQCPECNYSSTRSANYNMHYQMVHLKTRTLCQLCGKPYSNINQHMRVVHKTLKSGKTEKSKCSHCLHEYYDLEQHMRRAHKDLVQVVERDCTCFCGETFTKYANMKRHQLRIHQGYKVTCPVCNKKVSNIDKHKNVHKKKENKAVARSNQSSEDMSYVEEENILEITESHYIIQQPPDNPGVIQFSQLVPLMPVEIVQISKEQ